MNDLSIGDPSMDCGIVELSSEDVDLVSGGRSAPIRFFAKKVADAIAWGVTIYEGAKAVKEELEGQEQEEPPPEPERDQPGETGEGDPDSLRF